VGNEFFGEKLRLLRRAAGLTRVELGVKTKLSGGAISQFEKGGTKPSTDSLAVLSAVLDFDFSTASYGKPATDVQDADLGARLEIARKSKGHTQAELAEMVGVSRASIALYESGIGNPSLSILRALSLRLTTSLDWLVFGRESVTISANLALETRLQAVEAEVAAIRKEAASA
jgi:transcriptional regulator with XRE-family HTH domain